MSLSRSTVTVAVLAVLLAGSVVGSATVLTPAGSATSLQSEANETTTTSAAGEATILPEGEELVLQPEPNQTIRGETTVEPGTNLSVMVQSDHFIRTEVATVTEQGTFEVTIDLSSAHGEQLEIEVYRNDTELTATTGRVACAGGCETTASDATTDERGVTATTTHHDDRDGLLGRFTGGVGLIAVGGVLAVVGIGVVLGLFRN